jgi:hypothetical protein
VAEDKRKWFLLALIILLTTALIFIFRMKDLGKFVREQQRNLASFYTANLQPLFAQIKITNDDIFNFAFHNRLPLNNERNKFLVLGSEQNGRGYFTFTGNLTDDSQNYNEFTGKLELNKDQKAKVDSILDSYRDQLEEQVLVNDKNTMAINSKLWNLNKAILADVLAYTSKIKKSKLEQIVTVDHEAFNNPSIQNMIAHVKNVHDPNYIFVTPDSVFDYKFKVNEQKLKLDMDNAEVKLKEAENKINNFNFRIKFDKKFVENSKKAGNDFNVHVDPNEVKINIPKEITIPVLLPDMDKISKEISLSIGSTKTPEPPKNDKILSKKKSNSFHIKVNAAGDEGEPFELNINLPDVDSIMKSSLHVLDSLKFNMDWNSSGDREPDRNNAVHQKMKLLTERLSRLSKK